MIYKEIQEAINEGDTQKTVKAVKNAVFFKYPPENILKKGIIYGIEVVAEKFKSDDVMIPETLMSTRAMQAGLFTLNPYLKKKKVKKI